MRASLCGAAARRSEATVGCRHQARRIVSLCFLCRCGLPRPRHSGTPEALRPRSSHLNSLSGLGCLAIWGQNRTRAELLRSQLDRHSGDAKRMRRATCRGAVPPCTGAGAAESPWTLAPQTAQNLAMMLAMMLRGSYYLLCLKGETVMPQLTIHAHPPARALFPCAQPDCCKLVSKRDVDIRSLGLPPGEETELERLVQNLIDDVRPVYPEGLLSRAHAGTRTYTHARARAHTHTHALSP